MEVDNKIKIIKAQISQKKNHKTKKINPYQQLKKLKTLIVKINLIFRSNQMEINS